MTADNTYYNDIITTTPFCFKASEIIRWVLMLWLSKNWWWLALPIVVVSIMTIWCSVAGYVALMLIFLIYPTTLMLIYFNFILSPMIRCPLYRQVITISDGVIKRQFFSDERFECVPSDNVVNIEQVDHFTLLQKTVLITLKTSRYDIIPIPLNAFDSECQNHIADMLEKCGMKFVQ